MLTRVWVVSHIQKDSIDEDVEKQNPHSFLAGMKMVPLLWKTAWLFL